MWPSETDRAATREIARETIERRHIRLRPTRLGVGMAVMVALLWLVGLNYQANLAYIAAFWLSGFMLAAVLQNLRQLTGLQPQAGLPHEMFAGNRVPLRLNALANQTRRRLWLRVQGQEDWQEWTLAPQGSGLNSAETETATLYLPPAKRGRLPLFALELSTAAPFGICTAAAVWQPQHQAVVYPAPLPHTLPASGSLEEEGADAQRPSESGDLSHLQNHQNGTPMQRIAWKQYAKTGALLDKRFEAAEARHSSTLISYRDYPHLADKEQIAAQLCFRVLAAEQQGADYTLELPAQTLHRSRCVRETVLTALALW